MHGWTRRAGTWLWVWLVISCGTALLAAPRAILHDPGFYLMCGLRLAHGEVPYRDVFDFNPPLVMYLSALPAFAARLLSINPIPIFTAGVGALSAISALLADRTFRRVSPGATVLERLVVALVPLGPCALDPRTADPGQREHLFILLYYPFLLERVARFHQSPSASAWSTFGRGLLAAAGVCLKPYFVIPAIAVEVGLVLSTRRIRPLFAPEMAGAISFAAAYAAHVLLLPVAARAAFFDRIIPLVLHGYAHEDDPVLIFTAPMVARVACLPILYALAHRLVRNSLRVLLPPLACFTFGGLVEVIAQGKGWGYHYMTANTGMLALLAMTAAGFVDRVGGARPWVAGRLRGAATAALVAALLVWRPIHSYRVMNYYVYPFRATLQKYSATGDGVLVLSTSVLYAHPAVLQTDRRVASRHLSAAFWWLAVESARRGYAAGRTEQERFIAEVSEDITSERPAAIFIDTELDWANTAFAGPLRLYDYRGTEAGIQVYTRAPRHQ